MEDLDLVARAKAGDDESTRILVEKYHKLAYSVALSWVSKGAISREDAISEANLALIKCTRGSFDETRGTFAQYLAASVSNQIRMFLRKDRNRRRYMSDTDSDMLEVIADTFSVTDAVEDTLILEQAVAALPRLRKIEAECLLLRVSGEPYRRIAVQLSMSGTYAVRLVVRATSKLRLLIGESQDAKRHS